MKSILAIPSTRCPALQFLPEDRSIPPFPTMIHTGTGVCTCLSLTTPNQSAPLLHFISGPVHIRLSATPCHPFRNRVHNLLQEQEKYPFLTTLYSGRIQTRRNLDRHNYTHTGEFLDSPIHETIAFSSVLCKIPTVVVIQNVV